MASTIASQSKLSIWLVQSTKQLQKQRSNFLA
jgi:hypothetical protein